MRTRTPRNRGFTLIELVIVLSIISLLSAIAVPQFLQSVYQSRDAEAVDNMDTIRKMLTDYYNVNGQYPSVGGDWNPPDANNGGNAVVQWVDGEPGWKQIGFLGQGQAFRYQYQFVPGATDSLGRTYQVTINAQANLASSASAGHPKATTHQIILTNGELTQFDQPVLE
jgi:prepilin-type N-terminal cleavage/methylation domain-containing protein